MGHVRTIRPQDAIGPDGQWRRLGSVEWGDNEAALPGMRRPELLIGLHIGDGFLAGLAESREGDSAPDEPID